MRKTLLIWFLLQTSWAAGFAQSLPPNVGHLVPSANLPVQWDAATNPWPENLWVYRMIPTTFSPAVISNLMAAADYTKKDAKDYGTNGMIFVSSKKSGNMRISFTEGEIEYWTTPEYGPTNLAHDVPETDQLFHLATNFLPRIGINLSELKKANDGKPEFYYPEAHAEYYISNTVVTNIQYRMVRFGRQLDGVEFGGPGGDGEIDFGEHNRITKIWLRWPSLEHDKLYQTVKTGKIIQWIRDGNATAGLVRDNLGNEIDVDWLTVTNLTISKACAYYCGELFLGAREHRPVFPSSVQPFASLWATINVGTNTFQIGINSPVLEGFKP